MRIGIQPISGVAAEFAEAQRGAGFLWSPVALAAGIGAYFGAPEEPDRTLLLIFAAVAILGFLIGMKRRSAPAVLLALAATGVLLASFQTWRAAAPVLEGDYRGPVSGRLIGLDRSASNAVRLTLDQVHMPGRAIVPERIRISFTGYIAPGVLQPGTRVTTTAWLAPPNAPVEPGGFDFRRHAWFAQIGAVGYTRTPVLIEAPPGRPNLALRIFALRMHISGWLRTRMADDTGPFAAAILTGDRSALDPRDMEDLRYSNLAHLLAISGLHMGLITGLAFGVVRALLALPPGLALRWPAKKIAAGAALSVALFYLALSGASVATQRAFIMAAVALIAIMLDRPVLTLRAVAIAALIVMIVHPISLTGPGFQMSFAATTALVATFAALRGTRFWEWLGRGRQRHVKWLVVLMITSFVAGAATAPFSAYHFNTISRYGYIANLAAVPAMGLIVMPGAMLALALGPFGLEAAALGAVDLGIRHILGVAHWAASREGAVWHVPTGGGMVLPALTLGFLMLVLVRGRGRFASLAPLALGLVFWAAAERPALLVSENGRMLGLMTERGRALSAERGNRFAASIWLENDGAPANPASAAARVAWQKMEDGGLAGDVPGFGAILWSNAESPPPGACQKARILVAPKATHTPGGTCLFLGADALEAGGAHALFASNGGQARLVTVSDLSGDRPWTRAQDQ